MELQLSRGIDAAESDDVGGWIFRGEQSFN
jgi:hypothetical protein